MYEFVQIDSSQSLSLIKHTNWCICALHSYS